MSFYMSGPAVGIGDGTLLVGWPCRSANAHQDDPFNWSPCMAWIEEGKPRVLVLTPTGNATLDWATELQFDPTWKGKK